MLRILFVNKASLAYPGGAETRIRAVAPRLARMGHEVFMVCAKTSPGEAREERIDGVLLRRVSVMPDWLLRRFPVPSYLPQALFFVFAPPVVLQCVRRWRIDVVRDDMSPFPGLSVLAPVLGRRAIVVVHNLFGGLGGWRRFYPAPFALAGALGEWLLVRGLLRYRAIATAAPWVAEYLRERGARAARVEAIPNGIDLPSFSRRPPRGKIERIVSFGRFSVHKRLQDVVSACAELRDRGVAFELTFIGAGPQETALRSAISAAKLGDHARILPALPRSELLRALPEYDLFVLASSSEGLPLALLEAAASQLGLVVAARPWATTLLDRSVARLYDPDDPDDLAQALSEAIRDPVATEARAERARRWVEGFDWDRTAAAELALMSDACHEADS
ncbi:glycosyltransferase family 4 protein [Anaeromyxobacter oryzisoli]|uniref:glycosyltransferase family 4 protein n=1 Tax=Anaeromyxobacter oryzisoli TaxID=2925408 RepID=UPI001F56BE52|nr:glycosyltransferase family 4 protein [Anaeromyxobacter sp. SG63]